jgi:hypothetical protein
MAPARTPDHGRIEQGQIATTPGARCDRQSADLEQLAADRKQQA